MNLTLQLTDEHAERLAADILSLHKLSETAPLTESPSSPLPDPPDGFHPAIMGPIKVCSKMALDPDIFQYCRDGQWRSRANGCDTTPYALRIGSEIARLNGMEPEAKPKQP